MMQEHSDEICIKRASLILLAILILQTSALGETFVATQEMIIFAGNLTLVVEDVDPQCGEVWLRLLGENGTVKSEVSRVGENFAYEEGDIELTVANIYAGDESDLVALEINRGVMSERPLQSISDEVEVSTVPEKSTGFDIITVLISVLSIIGIRLLIAKKQAK